MTHEPEGGSPIGLAKAVSPEAKAATTAHLLETTLHEMTHGIRHAQAMLDDPGPDGAEWQFNADHCQKHLGGAVEHAGKLASHFRDNYPAEAKWLAGLDETRPFTGEGNGGEQHARYAKKGTIGAQLASQETVSGQVADLSADETVNLGVDVTGPAEQVARFAQLCKTIQVLGEAGASRTVQVDVDGDGNASLRFAFEPPDVGEAVKPVSFDSDPVRVPGIGG